MKTKLYFLFVLLVMIIPSLASCQSSEEKAKYLEKVKKSKASVLQSFNLLQNHYQKRLDLLPNLVRVMNASTNAGKLSSYISKIQQLRSSYTAVKSSDLIDNKISSSNYDKYIANQNKISTELGKLIPIIKSQGLADGNFNFEDMIAQIEGIEARIAVSGGDFEAVLKNHNIKYPDHKIDILTFGKSSATGKSPPKVDF